MRQFDEMISLKMEMRSSISEFDLKTGMLKAKLKFWPWKRKTKILKPRCANEPTSYDLQIYLFPLIGLAFPGISKLRKHCSDMAILKLGYT